MSHFQDRAYLRESQYRTSSHLAARADLHARFNVSADAWPDWVQVQLDLQPDEQVLECGGGPGWLWQSLTALPDGVHLTLTDLSTGMVAEAGRSLAQLDGGLTLATADIQSLPFPDQTFDVVIANHMLYHVPDIRRGVAEVARVLRPGGRFLAATNGRLHLRELFELGTVFFPESPLSLGLAMRTLPFALENGTEWLAGSFGSVELRPYLSHLEVDDAEALVAYMLSSAESQAAVSSAQRAAAVSHIAKRIETQGPIHVGKETGLFVARTPRIAA